MLINAGKYVCKQHLEWDRLRTDIWIQNSRLFSKTIISFPNSRLSSSSSIQTLKKAVTKLFSRCTANVWAKLDKIWPKRKKFNYKALVVVLKKTPDFLPFFQDFISGKLLGKFQDLPRTQTSLSRAQRKAGRRQRAVCTLPMVPCCSSPVARLYLAKNETPEEEAVSRLFQEFKTLYQPWWDWHIIGKCCFKEGYSVSSE